MQWSREGDEIVYRISIENLVFGFNNCPLFYDGETDIQIFRVGNQEDFIKSFVIAINREDEIGTTPIHDLLDSTFNHMVEEGELGILGGVFGDEE